MANKRKPGDWVTLEEALRTFVVAGEGTQGSSHIDPMHWQNLFRASRSTEQTTTLAFPVQMTTTPPTSCCLRRGAFPVRPGPIPLLCRRGRRGARPR